MIGISQAICSLARHSYLTEVVPVEACKIAIEQELANIAIVFSYQCNDLKIYINDAVRKKFLTCRWPGLSPTPPSKRYGFCLRRFFMVNLSHGREIQGSLGVQGLLLRSILLRVRLNGLSVSP